MGYLEIDSKTGINKPQVELPFPWHFVWVSFGNKQTDGLLSTKTYRTIIHVQPNTVDASWPTGVPGNMLGVMERKMFLILSITMDVSARNSKLVTSSWSSSWLMYLHSKYIPSETHPLTNQKASYPKQFILLHHMFRKTSFYLHRKTSQASSSPLWHINIVWW